MIFFALSYEHIFIDFSWLYTHTVGISKFFLLHSHCDDVSEIEKEKDKWYSFLKQQFF